MYIDQGRNNGEPSRVYDFCIAREPVRVLDHPSVRHKKIAYFVPSGCWIHDTTVTNDPIG
jgi:hypothetical protein